MGCSASVARPNDEKSAPATGQKNAGGGAATGNKPGAGGKGGWSGGKAGSNGSAAPEPTPAEETEEQWLAPDAGGANVPLQLPPHMPRGLRKFWTDCFATEVVTFDKFFDQVIQETEEQIPALADTARARIAERLRASGGSAGVLPPDEQLLRQLLRQVVLEMEPPGPGVNSRFSSADLNRLAHMCQAWAGPGAEPPKSMAGLLGAVVQGFEPRGLVVAEVGDMRAIAAGLAPTLLPGRVGAKAAAHYLAAFDPASRRRLIETYDGWVRKLPSEEGRRALLVYGGAGHGKSTAAAALASNPVLPYGAVAGAHFVRASDPRTCDPGLYVRTLVVQLAAAFPPLRPQLLMRVGGGGGEAAARAALGAEEVVERFLAVPLQKLESELRDAERPLVFIIDGLDEAGAAASGAGGGGGNPLLALIVNHLAKLPKAIRFVVFSRPEPDIVAGLDAAFGGAAGASVLPQYARPHMEDLGMLTDGALRHVLASPSLVAEGEALTEDTPLALDKERIPGVQAVLDKSAGAFAYLTRLKDGLRDRPRWTLADLTAFPAGLMPSYPHTFTQLVGAAGWDGSARGRAVRRALQVLLAAAEPPPIGILAAAWSLGHGGGADGAAAALAAPSATPRVARPEAAAEQTARLLLRHLGGLYVTWGGRVEPYHRSLHDWLTGRDAGATGEPAPPNAAFFVEAAPGHAALAAASVWLVAPDVARAAGLPELASAAAAAAAAALPAAGGVGGGGVGGGGATGHAAAAADVLAVEYALRYGVRHLVTVANGRKANEGASDTARAVLEKLLCADFGFWASVFRSGLAGAVLKDLQQLQPPASAGGGGGGAAAGGARGAAAAVPASPVTFADALRWLASHLPELSGARSTEEVVISAMGCPWGTAVYEAAARHWRAAAAAGGRPAWRLRAAVGVPRHWPAARQTLTGHTGYVTSAAWAPDGRLLATAGGEDRYLRLWDMAGAGGCTAAWQAHDRRTVAVGFNSEGRLLASAGEDPEVKVWAAPGGGLTTTLKGHTAAAKAVAWCPAEPHVLVTGSDDETGRVWDVRNGACTAVLKHGAAVSAVALSPDGRLAVTGGADYAVKVFITTSGDCTVTFSGHSHTVLAVAWHPQRRTCIASAGADRSILVWDTVTKSRVGAMEGHTETVRGLCWSPDGRLLASASNDTTVRVWDANSGSCASTLKGHTNAVLTVAWSAGGGLASGSADKSVRLWDPSAGKEELGMAQAHTDVVTGLAWSPDSTQLASSSGDGSVRLWDAAPGPGGGRCVKVLTGHSGRVRSVVWGATVQLLASGGDDSSVRLWDPKTGKNTNKLEAHSGAVNAVALSPDCGLVASGGTDSSVRVFDVELGGLSTATLRGQPATVRCVAWSPDAKQLAAASDDNCVRLWDLAKQACTETLMGHMGQVVAVAYSPSGEQLATASMDKSVRIWSVASGKCVATFENAHPDGSGVACLAWSPEGRLLASGGGDRLVRLWDVVGGGCVATIPAQGTMVAALAWSPNGRCLAAAAGKAIRWFDIYKPGEAVPEDAVPISAAVGGAASGGGAGGSPRLQQQGTFTRGGGAGSAGGVPPGGAGLQQAPTLLRRPNAEAYIGGGGDLPASLLQSPTLQRPGPGAGPGAGGGPGPYAISGSGGGAPPPPVLIQAPTLTRRPDASAYINGGGDVPQFTSQGTFPRRTML
ncbi:hypothetical protein HXX76_014582 [Chlamydomonas incerta]|uniref:Nephrocystin 3-like N-terminal domain-containing protein n=1 Tax=Chlamydomonas incerta TaxID=51695 RepID=A0A835SBS1_CHLIN|nr:hypothetical protein HXX76_014582 [Chlamydomonas incerta]|eukprot:KAG2424373.1 hypothetical protein HXX76_014582 [Chlamydomonas incerta]